MTFALSLDRGARHYGSAICERGMEFSAHDGALADCGADPLD
jgi:hypothetical protein